MFVHIDFDAFFCGVEEKKNPDLRNKAFIVAQKNCAATISYAARALGIRKLTKVSDIRANYPNVLIVHGEDLTFYKAEGQRIYEFVRDTLVPTCPVVRGGMEEIKIDLSRLIDCNIQRLESLGIRSKDDLDSALQNPVYESLVGSGIPLMLTEDGLHEFDCTDFFFEHAGSLTNEKPPVSLRLHIASHLAFYIQSRLKMEQRYSVSMGCARTAVLAKIISNENKPFGLTILDQGFQDYLDKQLLSKIPGFGSKVISIIQELLDVTQEPTVKQARENVNLPWLYQNFGKKQGDKLMDLLHGISYGLGNNDLVSVEYPKSISVEDSRSGLKRFNDIDALIDELSERLLKQMYGSLYDKEENAWKAVPRNLRISVRRTDHVYPKRSSKSAKFPGIKGLTAKKISREAQMLSKSLYKNSQDVLVMNVAIADIEPI